MSAITNKITRGYRFGRRVYRYALRRAFRRDLSVVPSPEQRLQFSRFFGKLGTDSKPVLGFLDGRDNASTGLQAEMRQATFDIGRDLNILDVTTNQKIDAFYLNFASGRDLVNLTNFLSAYGKDIPVLLGDRFRCRRLLSFVPVVSANSLINSVEIHHYFAKNYRITDTMLFQGYVYQGRELVDCHQFLMNPEDTRVFDIREEMDLKGVEDGMYYLEAFHPQLPTSTPELRFFGIYHDPDSDYMAGSHSIPMGSWHNFSRENHTKVRTYIPNISGTSVKYLIPGKSTSEIEKTIQATTTLGQRLAFTASANGGSIGATIPGPAESSQDLELAFDQIATKIPTQGGQGFTTLWREGNGFALWHDGGSVREMREQIKGHTIDPKAGSGTGEASKTSDVLFEEQLDSRSISGSMLDLYQSRAKYFGAVFPFVGHEFPPLNVVFDSQQWATDLTNFHLGLYSNEGTLLQDQPFEFNGVLQTVNMNRLFADQLAEISQGYWLITADAREQTGSLESSELLYPSDHMLFGFWGDGNRTYDSVHSLAARNSVAYDLKTLGPSEMAQETGRIVWRCKKYAPFLATEAKKTWYWVCNVGISEEPVDASVKVRLYGSDGLEEVLPLELPANTSRIISADEILSQSKLRCTQGTVWLESNDCNLAAMWFMQAGDNAGFAVDHFTGG